MINKSNTTNFALQQTVILMGMIYITLFLASMTVGYKIVAFGKELYCASIFIFPLLFPFSDALAEILGSKIAKSLIWYTVICEIIFVSLTNFAIHLPSPITWHYQKEYNLVVGGYIHIIFANITAMVIGFYLNINLLNRLRTLTKGKYYYLRSLGATAIGEIAYTIVTNVITYFGILHWNEIINIIFSDYAFKLIYSFIIAYPGALFVTHIKLKYSHEKESYNPFQHKQINKVLDFSEHFDNKVKFKSYQK